MDLCGTKGLERFVGCRQQFVKHPDSWILIVFCLRLKTAEMTIIVPGALFAAGVSLDLFHQYNRVKETKQEEGRETLNEIRQQYLQHLIEQKEGKTDSPPIRRQLILTKEKTQPIQFEILQLSSRV